MEADHRIVWLRHAAEDLERVMVDAQERDPEAAARLWHSINKSIETLAYTPHGGRPGRVPGTREKVIPDTPYIAPYYVKGKEVRILALMHGARRWPRSFDTER